MGRHFISVSIKLYSINYKENAMFTTYQDFIEKTKEKSIMIYGAGKSNLPLIKMLANEKIKVTVFDDKEPKNPELNLLKENPYIDFRMGDTSVWNNFFDIIIRSPGISFFSDRISAARANGSLVTSEMEIFFELCPCPIIGITGSDGKTTTTSIIYEILKQSGKKVHLGGNIGKPLLPDIKNISKDDIAVVELSSFQLMSMRRSPEIAVVTNISPNHLDYHSSIEEYIESKKQILFHQNAFSKSVLNFDNPETQKMQSCVRGKTIFFSRKQRLHTGVWIDDQNNIIYSEKGKDSVVINASEINLPGKHNLENYLAAIASTYEFVTAESILKVAREFKGIPHRMELVGDFKGVLYYNDSIASTPTRTISGALSLFDKKIILIAGGYDKKVPFDSLAREVLDKVSVLILMGNSANKIKNEVEKLKNYSPSSIKIILAKDMEQSVNYAYENSRPGDIVVLSPACASFDLYENFEQRGNHFKDIVNSLSFN